MIIIMLILFVNYFFIFLFQLNGSGGLRADVEEYAVYSTDLVDDTAHDGL